MGKPRFPFYLMDLRSSNKKSVSCLAASGQSAFGAIAKRLCSGLQSRLGRFDSGSRLQVRREKALRNQGFFFFQPRFHPCKKDA
ncbi:hypothetical protein BCEP4_100060 [Burkholderia cepacia]|nr:hypothetical protein BCEP4_100060 [Burkholderia cepacia]